jgi:Dihydrouridine synthase (Dus)
MLAAGADALAIHARRVGHEDTEQADWKTLEEVLAVVQPKYPDFSFLINVDFYDREERTEMMERTKAGGILLARPALYNMSTFLPIDQPLVDKTQVVLEYLRLVIQYDMHHKNTKYVICEMMSNRRTPTERVLKMPIVFPGGQTIGSTCACHDFESICRLWGLDYEHERATNTAVNTGGTRTTSSMPTMAASEHKYEDSYFLHKNSVDQGASAVNELEKLAAKPCASTCSDGLTPSKRAKLETGG